MRPWIALLALAAAGCGVKGDPLSPGGRPDVSVEPPAAVRSGLPGYDELNTDAPRGELPSSEGP
ncbi:hypothetical protein [Rubrimonas cliftonensis]|uniref:Uncharacterized protein n=1 Tax=Rubrimonas cliftonensis TaxID=89524 RepID=A0A1H4DJS5_9RHOB|nr:hypothetical protein [Rubrimonas cliftonensis]SEA72680.1 hypothetical protein SAMN05444370_11063 [Rubrimonas cliftonensis]